MDLSRLQLIRNSTDEQLKDSKYLESLIVKLGFNKEILHEQPQIVKQNGGGLLIWQYPNQFSKYLCLLQKYKIQSYIEIGCRWGGTFVLTYEYLKRFNKMTHGTAVDLNETTASAYCAIEPTTTFLKLDSHKEVFQKYIRENTFDLVFIDGDHSYNGVSQDYNFSKESGNIFVFHDICSSVCLGVVKMWNELKIKEAKTYDFYEFTEQYEEVVNATRQTFLGIGVAIKKTFLPRT